MADIQIQTHNFEGAKTEICKMARNAPRSVSFTKVETEGTGLGGFLFGTNHNVTGSELNKLIREVQSAFSVVHQNTQQIHGALYQVYNAFESLDEDYIQYILKNLEATKVAADTAKKTADALAASLPKIKDKIADSERKMQYEIDRVKSMANTSSSGSPVLLYVLASISTAMSIAALLVAILR